MFELSTLNHKLLTLPSIFSTLWSNTSESKNVKTILLHPQNLTFSDFLRCELIFASSYYKQILELRHLEIPKATLLKGLIRTAACISPTEYQQQYLLEILTPIRDR